MKVTCSPGREDQVRFGKTIWENRKAGWDRIGRSRRKGVRTRSDRGITEDPRGFLQDPTLGKDFRRHLVLVLPR